MITVLVYFLRIVRLVLLKLFGIVFGDFIVIFVFVFMDFIEKILMG